MTESASVRAAREAGHRDAQKMREQGWRLSPEVARLAAALTAPAFEDPPAETSAA